VHGGDADPDDQAAGQQPRRAAQAAAGAALLTNSAAIVSAAFPERLLSRGMGIYLASFSVATLLGPTVGGLLTTNLGWRWVFWFNVPVGVAALPACSPTAPSPWPTAPPSSTCSRARVLR
jgi:MFS family permease